MQQAKPLEGVAEALSELPIPWQFVVIPGVAVVFTAAGKFGVLNAISGIGAKALLDGWNVFANIALPGAILKY